MLMEVICLTISEGEWRSITRLWILSWNLSQVLEPSPQGVLRVVILRTLVGILTGPLTYSNKRLIKYKPKIVGTPSVSTKATILWLKPLKAKIEKIGFLLYQSEIKHCMSNSVNS